MIFTFISICRGWIWYMFPGFLLGSTVFMLWNKYHGSTQLIEAFEVATPPRRRTVEQLLALQEAISQLETHVQAGNIFLLKLRSLMLAAFPQVTWSPPTPTYIQSILCCISCILSESDNGQMVAEHEQSCGGDAPRGCIICASAVQEHICVHFAGDLHEAYANEEEEQWEAGEEVEGVVAPDPSCSRTALEASWHEMEIEVEIKIKTNANIFTLSCISFVSVRNVYIIHTTWLKDMW